MMANNTNNNYQQSNNIKFTNKMKNKNNIKTNCSSSYSYNNSFRLNPKPVENTNKIKKICENCKINNNKNNNIIKNKENISEYNQIDKNISFKYKNSFEGLEFFNNVKISEELNYENALLERREHCKLCLLERNLLNYNFNQQNENNSKFSTNNLHLISENSMDIEGIKKDKKLQTSKKLEISENNINKSNKCFNNIANI